MAMATEVLRMGPNSVPSWGVDWAWSLPLVVLTVVMHSFSLRLISQEASRVLNRRKKKLVHHGLSMFLIGGTALGATILHGIEAWFWALAYMALGAIPGRGSAMLYSLNAITSYGHESIALESRWQLMGSIEALNGWILFGLTTAFLFAVIQKVWAHTDEPT
jgi:hypothetical protein